LQIHKEAITPKTTENPSMLVEKGQLQLKRLHENVDGMKKQAIKRTYARKSRKTEEEHNENATSSVCFMEKNKLVVYFSSHPLHRF
jgi:hypothetical protein